MRNKKRTIQTENSSLPTVSDYLRREFDSRQLSNSRYTLRAFARDAGLYPSKMSEILRGKRGVSGKRAKVIARRLNWDIETSDAFFYMALSQSSRKTETKADAKRSLQTLFNDRKRHLSEEEFHFLSDWYHLAALSLAEALGRPIKADDLTRHLDLNEAVAEKALTRLANLKLIEKKKDGAFTLVARSTITPSARSSLAIRTFHNQIIEKSKAALVNQSTETRDNSAVIFTVKKENVPQAKELIREFRKKFLNLMSPTESAGDSVYCLSTQLFEIANINHQMEKKNEP